MRRGAQAKAAEQGSRVGHRLGRLVVQVEAPTNCALNMGSGTRGRRCRCSFEQLQRGRCHLCHISRTAVTHGFQSWHSLHQGVVALWMRCKPPECGRSIKLDPVAA